MKNDVARRNKIGEKWQLIPMLAKTVWKKNVVSSAASFNGMMKLLFAINVPATRPSMTQSR